MGTYVSISIGEFDFLTSKNSFGELLLPFSSRDLRIEDAFDEDGEQYTRRYFSSTVSRLKLILDSYGFTIEVAKQNFATLKTEKLDFIQYCLESDGETFGRKMLQPILLLRIGIRQLCDMRKFWPMDNMS